MVVALASCGSSSAKVRAQPAPMVSTVEQAMLPVPYETVERSEQRLIVDCLRRHGWHLFPPLSDSPNGSAIGPISDLAVWTQYQHRWGYGVVDTYRLAVREQTLNSRSVAKLTSTGKQNYLSAVWGTRESPGCEPRSIIYIQAPTTAFRVRNGQTLNSFSRAVGASPAVRRTTHAYSACMHEHGWAAVGDLGAGRRLISARLGEVVNDRALSSHQKSLRVTSLRKYEVRMSAIDLRCARSLIVLLPSAYRKVERQFISTHRLELADLRASVLARLRAHSLPGP